MWDFLKGIGESILGEGLDKVPIIGGTLKKVFGIDQNDPDLDEKINQVITADPNKMIEFKQALFSHQEEMAKIDVASKKLQTDINLADANSKNKFQSNWRPFIGWGCGYGLIYAAIVWNILTWASLNFGWVPPPEVEGELLWPVLTGMLGIAGLRSRDKEKGTDTKT